MWDLIVSVPGHCLTFCFLCPPVIESETILMSTTTMFSMDNCRKLAFSYFSNTHLICSTGTFKAKDATKLTGYFFPKIRN